MNRKTTQELIDRLKKLQLEETKIISELENRNQEIEETPHAALPQTNEWDGRFRIGDRAQIVNPSKGHAALKQRQGTVSRIGPTNRVSLNCDDGTRRFRQAKNLLFLSRDLEEEE